MSRIRKPRKILKNIIVIFLILLAFLTGVCINEFYDDPWKPIKLTLSKIPVLNYLAEPYSIDLVENGIRFMMSSEYDKAIVEFENALDIFPNSRHALFEMGRAYYFKQNFDKAIEYFDDANRIDNERNSQFSLKLQEWRAFTYRKLGNMEAAEKAYLEAYGEGAIFHYEYGERLRKWGEYDLALEHLTSALERNDRMEDAYKSRARVYLRQKNYHKAIEDLESVISLDEYDYDSMLLLSETLFETGNYERIIDLLSGRVLASLTKDSSYKYKYICQYNTLVGKTYIELNRFEEALPHLDIVAGPHKLNPSIMDKAECDFYEIGAALTRIGVLDNRYDLFDRAIRQFALASIGGHGHLHGAANHLRKLTDQEIEVLLARFEKLVFDGADTPDEYTRLGAELMALDDLQRASVIFKTAYFRFPEEYQFKLYQGAVGMIAQASFEAREDLTEYLENVEHDSLGYFMRSIVSDELGDLEGSRSDYEKVAPNDLRQRFSTATFYFSIYMDSDAITGKSRIEKEIEEMLDEDPESPDAYIFLAGLQFIRNEKKEALESLEKARAYIGDENSGMDSLTIIAAILCKLDQPEAAIDFLKEQIDLHPDAPSIHLELAKAYVAARDYESAISEYIETIWENDDAEVHYHLACAYGLNGQDDKAMESLETAAALGFSDLSMLMTDPELEPLRNRPDFKIIFDAVSRNYNSEFLKPRYKLPG